MILLSRSQIVTTMLASAKQPSATPKTPGSAAVAAAAGAANGSKTDGTAIGKAANGSYKSPAAGRLFTFGVCTDVQYADLPEGKSHGGTARFYRDSLNGLRRAVQGWKDRGVEFGMHLGDVVDGSGVRTEEYIDSSSALFMPHLLHVVSTWSLRGSAATNIV